MLHVSGVGESVEPFLAPKDAESQLQRPTDSLVALREPKHLPYVYLLTFKCLQSGI